MRLLGRGKWTRCYKLNEKRVLLKSSDIIKNIMSDRAFPKSKYFPSIRQTQTCGEYTAPLYERITAPKQQLLPEEYAKYLDLCRAIEYSYCPITAIEKIKHVGMRKAVERAYTTLIEDFGLDGVHLEVSPRNIASKQGKLILLDIFFTWEQ